MGGNSIDADFQLNELMKNQWLDYLLSILSMKCCAKLAGYFQASRGY